MPRPEAVLAEQGWGALSGVLCGVCQGEGIKPIGDPDQMQAEGFQSSPGPSIPLTGLAKPRVLTCKMGIWKHLPPCWD